MSEGSRWTPMSGRTSSRMFGIYREPDPSRRSTVRINFKLILLLLVLATSALAVCVVSIKLSKDDEALQEEKAERRSGVEVDSVRSESTPPWPNSTDSGMERVPNTLSRPVQAEVLTETYSLDPAPQGERAVILEATTTTGQQGRRARAYLEELREERIVHRPRFPDQDLGAYSQVPSYTDQYAQLEGYRNPVRGMHEVMSWVEKPGVKFSGVYFKAEDSRPYLNGHAYVSDPFVKFKPSHPAEINQLAVQPERGTRFSNRPTDSFVSNSHTQAVFHPYTPMRPRPLKIMLDIYPMVPETPQGSMAPEFTADPRGRRQRLTTPTNRMIVHLNLYPKKNTRISRRRPTLTEEGIQERMFTGITEADQNNITDEMTTVTAVEETTLSTTTVVDDV